MSESWPFSDPQNVAVITLKEILKEGHPILHVTHNADDACWQFLGSHTPHTDDASVVALKTVLKIDPTIAALADLPIGWEARRKSKADSWIRSKKRE